ncbi:hypothetical protein IQ06DRAFT_304221 [Phaeosphaeriaceae sp. SRC1lsM3a]|nr:hypothetical protein IQ06DRAFT_304221 [Stagonospora sp. SRC1lsM3a]
MRNFRHRWVQLSLYGKVCRMFPAGGPRVPVQHAAADYGTGQPIRRRNPGSGGRTTDNSSTQEWVSCADEERTHSRNGVFTDFVSSPPRAPSIQRARCRCCAGAVHCGLEAQCSPDSQVGSLAGGYPPTVLAARRASRGYQTGVPEFCPSSANSRNTCHAVLGRNGP